jgi:hypothetical protein
MSNSKDASNSSDTTNPDNLTNSVRPELVEGLVIVDKLLSREELRFGFRKRFS